MRVDSVLNVLLSECKWVTGNYPQVLLGENLWRSWFNNLSEYDISNLRMNKSGIAESRDFMSKELHIREKNYVEFMCIDKIYSRLVILLLCIDGKSCEVIPIPEGW